MLCRDYWSNRIQTFVPRTSITFVSQASVDTGTIASYNLRKRIEVVKNCRKIGKKDMKFNDIMPKMKVDPESYVNFSNPLHRTHPSTKILHS